LIENKPASEKSPVSRLWTGLCYSSRNRMVVLEERRYKTNVTYRIWVVTKCTGRLRNYVKCEAT
jgi:hypothetical protein